MMYSNSLPIRSYWERSGEEEWKVFAKWSWILPYKLSGSARSDKVWEAIMHTFFIPDCFLSLYDTNPHHCCLLTFDISLCYLSHSNVQERNFDLNFTEMPCILIMHWSDWHRVWIPGLDAVMLPGGNVTDQGLQLWSLKGPGHSVHVSFPCVLQCLKVLICSHFPLFINAFCP